MPYWQTGGASSPERTTSEAVGRLLRWAVLILGSSIGCTDVAGPPPVAEVVGVWRLAPAAQERLSREGFRRHTVDDHRVELGSDGKCDFRSYTSFYPDSSGRSGDASYIAKPVTCSWQPISVTVRAWSRRRSHGALSVHLAALKPEGAAPNVTTYIDVVLNVEKREAGLVLTAPIGDPDNEEVVEYVRVDRASRFGPDLLKGRRPSSPHYSRALRVSE
jgi:hypothetical protein